MVVVISGVAARYVFILLIRLTIVSPLVKLYTFSHYLNINKTPKAT